MVFLPVVGGLIGRSEQRGDKLLTSLGAENELDIVSAPGMTGKYLRLLDRCIRHPIISISSAIAVLVIVIWSTAGLVMASSISLMLSQIRQIYLLRRGNLSVDEIDAATRKVEDILLRHRVFCDLSDGPGVKAGGNPRFDNDAPRDMVGRY